ncbi:threonine synthase [Basidiobolus meristosporus CBS 931.73]|uniref:threonine synthase n=1 Tax=Basidiobolus meristosporus CBS 931.73 TaxID=1314790 RepID=A0A1Y1YDA2_9FUNG|nr:threonine synthase [Basidiobolus meristosporus CBS 931.73]|eukprot:ORX96011.1 threonine synthase [Basidiobolus meristosporus CBS 931.73]
MKYRSTRGQSSGLSFEDTVLTGLAPDGGLFIPHEIPALPENFISEWANLSFQELAVKILSLFIDPAEIPTEDLQKLIEKSYSTFRHSEVTPIRKINKQLYILELFHGPTFAFKDVALQFLGNLFEYFLERKNSQLKEGEEPHFITVVGATSGDTGSAAIYGLRGKKNVSVFILHPRGRVSPIQEAQMTTVLDKNVHNFAVEGTFDDCQDIVKALFNEPEFKKEYRLGAINSINWARILAQIVYYFYSYFSLLRDLKISPNSEEARTVKVQFSVPTGNFGDILAGYYAYRMGLPVDNLLIATNSNDILYRFYETGSYEKQEGEQGGVKETLSPAMDILISSNFERLLWYLARENEVSDSSSASADQEAGEIIFGWMKELKETGRMNVKPNTLANFKEVFTSRMVNDQDTIDTIKSYYHPSDKATSPYILDPHTAVGVHAADMVKSQFQDYYTISLSTAHPAKFSEAVERALLGTEGFTFESVLPKEFIGLLDKERRCLHIKENSANAVKQMLVEQLRKDLQ